MLINEAVSGLLCKFPVLMKCDIILVLRLPKRVATEGGVRQNGSIYFVFWTTRVTRSKW